MHIRSRCRRWLERRGLYARRVSQLPLGVDWMRDVKRLLGRDPVLAVDIGANVGQTALRMHELYAATIIHSFEPIPGTFDLLQRNVAAFDRIRPHPLAMDQTPGRKTVLAVDGSTVNSLDGKRHTDEPAAHEVEITCETLDRFCDAHDIAEIDVLKSDTEGFDLQVIRGARQVLADGRVRLIVAEVTFDPENDGCTNFLDFAAELSRHQYFPVTLYPHEALNYGVLGEFSDGLFAHRSLLPGLR